MSLSSDLVLGMLGITGKAYSIPEEVKLTNSDISLDKQ